MIMRFAPLQLLGPKWRKSMFPYQVPDTSFWHVQSVDFGNWSMKLIWGWNQVGPAEVKATSAEACGSARKRLRKNTLIDRSRKGCGRRFQLIIPHEELVFAEAPRKQNQLTNHPRKLKLWSRKQRQRPRGRQVGLYRRELHRGFRHCSIRFAELIEKRLEKWRMAAFSWSMWGSCSSGRVLGWRDSKRVLSPILWIWGGWA